MAAEGKALYALHMVLIGTAILYCFGFALYQLRQYSEDGTGASLAAFFTAAGIVLCVYLRSVFRYARRRDR
jgi:hypothetical protein